MLLRVYVLTTAALAGTPATASQTGAAAHDANLTLTTVKSIAWGGVFDADNATVPWNTGCNGIDNVVDNTNTCCYGTFDTNATVTPGALSVGSVASFPGGMAAVEILPVGGTSPTEDASSPAVVDTLTATTVTTAAFAPAGGGTYLLAIVVSNGNTGTASMSVSDTGSHTWTQQASAASAGQGYVGVWTAPLASGATTVTATAGGGGAANGIALQVLALDGAALAATPVVGSQSGVGAHQESVTPSTNYSIIYGGVMDGDAATIPWDTGNTGISNQTDATNGVAYGTFYNTTGATGAGTPKNVGSDSSFNGGMAALEVIPKVGGTPPSTDGSSPAFIYTAAAGTVTSASFTPGGSVTLLVAIVVANGTNGAQVSMGVSDTAGHTWTQQAVANTVSQGYVGVWTAPVGGGSVAPSATLVGDAQLNASSEGTLAESATLSGVATLTASGSVSGTGQKLFAVPYSFPPSQYWDDVIANIPNPIALVLCSTDTGNAQSHEANFATVFQDSATAGATCVGYVSTNGATVAQATVEADCAAWNTYYGANGVTGIFLDVCACTAANEAYYQGIVNYVHENFPGWIVVLNPGGIPDQDYLSFPIGDIIQVEENSYANFLNDAANAPSWLFNHSPNQISVVVNTCPNEADMANALGLAASKFNAGYVWVTADDAYSAESPYFAEMIALAKSGPTSTAGTAVLAGSGILEAASGVTPSGVNVWFNQDNAGYGPVDIGIANASGHALIAFIGVGSDNVQGYLPRLAIGDDAHNWWIYAGSASSTTAGAARRLDVWVAPNARPATVVSVGSSQIYAGLLAAVYEVENFPDYATVDFVATASSSSAASLAPSGTATVSDYAFGAALVSGTGNPSFGITTPGTWNEILATNTATDNTDMASQTLGAAWAPVSAGTVTGTWSWASDEYSLAVIVGFSQNPPAPSQPNANWPSVKVEAAFGYEPGSLTGGMPTWTDITSRARDDAGASVLDAKRGRDYELSQPEAGDMKLWLDNHDGAFNPSNASSPYYPNVTCEIPIRVSATWNGRQYGIFYGYVNKWPQDFPNPQWGFVPVEASDAIGIMSQGQMPSAYAGEVLADYPYIYLPLGDYYEAPNGSQFSNLSRVNLRPGIGSSQTGLLGTGLTMNLAGDDATGIGVSGLEKVSEGPGAGVFVRDSGMPQLGNGDSLTLEFWGQVPTIAGIKSNTQLMALACMPTNYVGSNNPLIGPGTRLTVIYESSGTSGTNADDTILVAFLGNNAQQIIPQTFQVNAGALFCLQATVVYVSSADYYNVTLYVNGTYITSGIASAGALDVNGLLVGPVGPLNQFQEMGNWQVGQAAVYPWAVPSERLAAHYAVGATAATGDPVLARVGKLAQWSGVGLPVLGSVSSVNPLIGNADQVQGSALADALYTLTVDEGGMFFAPANATGTAWYSTRASLYNKSSKVTFGDLPTSGEIPYDAGSGFDFSDAYLFNIVSSQRTISASEQLFIGAGGQASTAQYDSYGVTAVTQNETSEAEYFDRGPLQLPIETTSDQDAYDRANWSLTKYQQPMLRADQIRIDLASNPTLFAAVLGLEQGDVVTVNRRPIGAVEISLTCIIEQVEHNIGPSLWGVTFTLAPYFPENAVIQLDNTSFNELGDGCLGW